jgi:hypothetical protein
MLDEARPGSGAVCWSYAASPGSARPCCGSAAYSPGIDADLWIMGLPLSGVDQFAAATGATTAEHDGHYTAIKSFGPIKYTAAAISSARMAAHRAETSYQGCIKPDLQS